MNMINNFKKVVPAHVGSWLYLFTVMYDGHLSPHVYTHISFEVFFYRNWKFMKAQNSARENFTLSIDMVLPMIWNEFKNNHKDPVELAALYIMKKNILSSYTDKLMGSGVGQEIFSTFSCKIGQFWFQSGFYYSIWKELTNVIVYKSAELRRWWQMVLSRYFTLLEWVYPFEILANIYATILFWI